MLGQRAGIRLERLYAQAIAHRWAAPSYLRHQLIDDAQLLESRPVGVALAPPGSRLQPYRECLREVLRRMGLRIPFAQVMHVTAAAGPCLVPRGILQGGGTEDLAPALAAAKPVGVVERVTRLVAQDA